ncbi:hypothetical protein [Actinomadura sp. DC4]|uniref:hypothetical protein n=1 Tax=Actinomadura sp. DC4 TaxID=3055069 RepID=UPI0025AF7DC2|nr:hypothetical protein [Actinomadura sp. DC4]MDN3356001.1 hypothetical protein [Actinomadura sp. DC4]
MGTGGGRPTHTAALFAGERLFGVLNRTIECRDVTVSLETARSFGGGAAANAAVVVGEPARDDRDGAMASDARRMAVPGPPTMVRSALMIGSASVPTAGVVIA